MRWVRILASTLALVVAGCEPFTDADGTATIATSPESTVVAAPPTLAEWVLAARDQAMYLRWEASAGAVAGVAQIARRSASGAVEVTSATLVGRTNGPQVVLDAGGRTWSGTISGNELVLAVNRQDGSRIEHVLVAGSVADFDAAVDALRRRSRPATTPPTSPPTTTTTEVTSTATPPAPSRPDVVDELAAATERLAALRAVDATVAAVEAALDEMTSTAEAVRAALPHCRAAGRAARRLRTAADEVLRAVGDVDGAAAQIEQQRALVMDIGWRVVALHDRAFNPDITRTNDELNRADAAAAELHRYAEEVRTTVTTTTEAADAARASSGC